MLVFTWFRAFLIPLLFKKDAKRMEKKSEGGRRRSGVKYLKVFFFLLNYKSVIPPCPGMRKRAVRNFTHRCLKN
jgi:hypothetical protein